MRFSIEAEQSLVGGLLLDPNRLDDVLEITGAEDFYSADNRSIMRYITEVAQAGRTADVITVADAMSGAGMLEALATWLSWPTTPLGHPTLPPTLTS
jgi:replicative DNA helicase